MRMSPLTSKNKNGKINFKRILKLSSFLKNKNNINIALSRNNVFGENYKLKKLKDKASINNKSVTNIKSNLNLEEKKNKNEIPYEISTLIDINENKFKQINKIYNNLKQENKNFISHYRYIQNRKLKNYYMKNSENSDELNEKSEEYKKIEKMYEFSNRDKIEMELQKNLTKKIFKLNPLIINNDNEMYFYFLKEAENIDNNKNKIINFNEQNSSKYLIKVKDFLEYLEISLDKRIDDLNKAIKLQNCNYVLYQDKRIEEEEIKLKEENKKKEKQEIFSSRNMIKKTNNLLEHLSKDKNYLEDPNYFTFYPRKNLFHKIFTPKKILSKNIYKPKFEYNTIRILKSKKENLFKELNSLLNDSNKKSKKIKKLRLNSNNISYINKNYNESYSKDYNISSKLFQNNSSNNIFQSSRRSKKFLPSIKKNYPSNIYNNSNISNWQQSSEILQLNNDLIEKSENKIKESTIIDANNKSNSNELENSINLINNSSNEEIKENLNLEPKKIIISDLYDELKDMKKLDENNLKEIDEYIEQENIEYKRKKNIAKIIKEAQTNSDELDINKIAKSFHDISNYKNKEYIKIKKIKNMNSIIKALDKKYIKEICNFKANINNENFQFINGND